MKQIEQTDHFQAIDTQPLYNIKAVVASTGLPAATLRVWERRYGVLTPRRTENGYRLYSARDVAVLRWLKSRVEEGLSISQAIAMLDHKRKDGALHQPREQKTESYHGAPGARESLVESLLNFDEGRADRVMEEAFAMYGVEAVTEHIIAPVMAEIGNRWHRGVATTAVEHFASNYLRRKIDAVINAAPTSGSGPLVVMGCAPGDWHELGLLSFYLLLRRRGLKALYLGQNVPVMQFVEEMIRLRPALVIISASTTDAVAGLIELAKAVQAMPAPRPVFAYGGHVFSADPDLRQGVPGIFLGESARSAVEYVIALLQESASQDGAGRLKLD